MIVIRIEGTVTAEDMYRYQQLRDEFVAQQIPYAIVWEDDPLWIRTTPPLLTQAEHPPADMSSMNFFRLWRTALTWIWMQA